MKSKKKLSFQLRSFALTFCSPFGTFSPRPTEQRGSEPISFSDIVRLEPRSVSMPRSAIAGLLVTTEAMVAEAPKKSSPPPAMPGGGGMGGMDF
jgi:hypothetical protein